MGGPAINGHLPIATLLLFLHVMMTLLALLAILHNRMMMLACFVSTYVKFELGPINALIVEDFVTHHLVVEDLKIVQVAVEGGAHLHQLPDARRPEHCDAEVLNVLPTGLPC